MSVAKRLVIVESAGKVKKVQAYLGGEFRVMASMGHVRDLPPDALGVDVEAGFVPTWQAVKGKGTVIKKLVAAMQEADAIYLATDPDREGEAIAAHIVSLTRLPRQKPVMRATFTAITRDAVRQAIEHPRPLDMRLVSAQHARRKLDRLVGYLVSPVACRALDGRYSAGRVQSPALRLVVERERAIAAFVPETYFVLSALLGANEATFLAKLTALQGHTMPLKAEKLVNGLVARLDKAAFWVAGLKDETVARKPPAPFTTSTLQQAASTTLGLPPEKTMTLAQGLYEAGKITYMRTDAVFVAPEAQTMAADFIRDTYGAEYLPEKRPQYRSKPGAQEAHEAIRPTDVAFTPEQGDEALGAGAALYGLIWRRFVASQMAAGRDSVRTAHIDAGDQVGQPFPLKFEARGITRLFDGFRRIYQAAHEDEEQETDTPLPPLMEGQVLTLHKLIPEKKQTQPPRRFSEAGLIQELEKRGIGRPSTYATILSTLKSRGYVRIEKKRLVPTETGATLSDYLMGQFGDLFADDYTARMESQLDAVASGQVEELAMLRAFWGDFHPRLQQVTGNLPEASSRPKAARKPKSGEKKSRTPRAPKAQAKPTGEKCPRCGSALVYRQGPRGQFVGCSGFPKCRYSAGLEHAPLNIQPKED